MREISCHSKYDNQSDKSTDCKNASRTYHSTSTSNIDLMLGVMSDMSAF